jgi:hypothetical protein
MTFVRKFVRKFPKVLKRMTISQGVREKALGYRTTENRYLHAGYIC